jgi:hypothetical protein
MKRSFARSFHRQPSRSQTRTLRPTFESLEGRIVMSANPVLPSASSGMDLSTTVNAQPAAGI